VNLLLIACVVLGALASCVAGALAFDLHRSDPAGNGLTQAYLVIDLGLTWLLVGGVVLVVAARAPHAGLPADLPWAAISWSSIALLVLAIGAQFPAYTFLSDANNRGAWFRVLQWCVPVLPLAFVVHASWRLGLPLPWQLACWGCAAVVLAGSLVALAGNAMAGQPAVANQPRAPEIVLPALLVQDGVLVRVLRDREDLRAMPRELVPRLHEPFVVDANRHRFALRDLHPVIGMQKDVTALSFVLPR
jgi:hypothetical protein